MMTIEEELALIKNGGPPADPAIVSPVPAAPPVQDPAAVAAALGIPAPETNITAPPEADAGTWDILGAAWTAETIRTDAWDYASRRTQELAMDMASMLSPEARAAVYQRFEANNGTWDSFADEVVKEAARDAAGSVDGAARFAAYPQTREALKARIDADRRADLDEAQAILDQPGGGFAEFVGSSGRAMTDAASLLMIPLGVGGGAIRTILGETAFGMLGEVPTVIRENQVAGELDLPKPDAVSRILMGGALAGGLSATILGVVKGVGMLRARNSATRAATPGGADAIETEIEVDAAEAALIGQQTVTERIRTTGSPSLGDILAGSGTKAKVRLANEGATRRQPIAPELETSLSQAVGEVYGPGFEVRVYSGGQPTAAEGGARVGTTRHDHGLAADVRIYGPDGTQVTGDGLAPLAQYWVARGMGGVGLEMQGGGIHLDVHTDRPTGWSYGDLTPGQQAAIAAGRRGEMPRLGGQIGAGVGGSLPNTPGLSYNEEATVTAIIGGESNFDPLARNPNSSAAGLGQILSGTWNDLIRVHRPDLLEGRTPNEVLALRDDQNLNRAMTAAYARDNHAAMVRVGITPGPGEIYLAHFLGPTGAIKILKADPNTPISQLMTPKQIADNKGVRWGGRALADFRVYDLVQWSRSKMRTATGMRSGPSADVPTVGTSSRGYTGQGQVAVGDEFRIDVEYVVVDASSLTRASGDFQPRDRSRIASDAWISDTAARLDPAQLMPSPTADRGAPIVGPDGMIESGNGRFGAIERAYQYNPDRAAAYRSAIEGAGFAIPEGVTRPVLIARRTSDLSREDRVRMTVAAQDSGVAVMTATETARASARAMTTPILGRLDPGQPIGADANAGFVRDALSALPRSARNAMFDGKGLLNKAGERQLREAIFARAWDDPDIVEMFTEGDAGDLKSLLDALADAAPSWAALKADIEAGRVDPAFDVSGHVLDAMRLIAAARASAARDKLAIGKALDELLAEVDLIQGAVAPLTAAMVRKFYPGARAAPAEDVAKFLTRYADDARKAGAGGGMFDAPTPRDVLAAIDAPTFGNLPEDLGPVRGFARPGQQPDRVAETAGYDEGAVSVEAEAAAQAARDALVDRDNQPFGPVYSGFTDNPEGAIAKIMSEKGGEVPDAFVHPELGAIAFVYGKLHPEAPKRDYGLIHILQKHGQDMLARIPEILRTGSLSPALPRKGTRRYIQIGDPVAPPTAVIRLDFDDTAKTWLVTAFDDVEGVVARQVRTSNEPPATAPSRIPDATEQVQNTPDLPADQGPGLTRADDDPEADAIAAALADARAAATDMEIQLPDGTTVSAREYLDDLEAEAQLDAAIQACAIPQRGSA